MVELLGNGSGFLRVKPPEPSDDDVYISAAQVRRCELVSGDRVAGPGAHAAALRALPVARPHRHDQRPPGRRGRRGHALRGAPRRRCRRERFALGGDDPTLKAIEWLTPIGRGSRVDDRRRRARRQDRSAAPARGRARRRRRASSVTRRARRRAPRGDRRVARRPGRAGDRAVVRRVPRRAGQALERAVETAKRIAARGGHAVVLIDTLAALPPHAARRRWPRRATSRRRLADGHRHGRRSRSAARRRSSRSTRG